MAKKKIAIVARYGGYGGAYNLNRAINQYSYLFSSELIVSQHDPYKFGDGITVREKNIDTIGSIFDNSDYIFVCDITGIHPICKYLSIIYKNKIISKMKKSTICDILKNKTFTKWIEKKTLIFYWTGSIYRSKHYFINKWARNIGSKIIFSMCDLTRFDKSSIPLMQTYEPDIFPNLKKNRELTIVHYPGECGNRIEKKVCRKLKKSGIIVKQLKGILFKDYIREVSQSHLFIDQISDLGGIGKAGLEAMIMGIPVMGDISKSTFDGYYNNCPVVQASGHLYEQIIEILKSNEYVQLGVSAFEWSKKLWFKNTVEYIEEIINLHS